MDERFAGLAAMILVGAGGEGLAGLLAHPNPALAGEVGGGEDDDVLVAGLGELAVELEAGGVVGDAATGSGALPDGETFFLGDCGERVGGLADTEGELLAQGFPAELLDEEFGEIAGLEERSGAGAVEGHGEE